jgi:hypothetical protein
VTPLPTLYSGYAFGNDYIGGNRRPSAPEVDAASSSVPRRRVTPEKALPPPLRLPSRPGTGDASVQAGPPDQRDSVLYRSTITTLHTPTLGGRHQQPFEEYFNRPGSAPPASVSARTSFSVESGATEDAVESNDGEYPGLVRAMMCL